jgi:diaminopropionate ammonia-lyase
VTTSPWYANAAARRWSCSPPPDAARFHRALPAYRPTPLRDVPVLAAEWGVRRVVVKDESARLGLSAFKALGVFYAIHRILSDRAGRPVDDLAALRHAARHGPLELITATDGNHGRALAHVAELLGLPCRVFVPDVVAGAAIDAIRGEGAEVVVVAEDYDKAVALAAEDARDRAGAVLVQDTAWPGYEEIPQYIVDGYSTMFAEVDDQLGVDAPSLVVTPMGVGSLAQAVLTHYKSRGRPVAVLGVEPDTAACVRASLRLGRLRSVITGSTVMAGLNCGTPSSLAWPFLRDGLDITTVVSDGQSTAAAAELGALGVPAGPCGAACVPAVRSLLADADGRPVLGLTPDSVVVLLSTEKSRENA